MSSKKQQFLVGRGRVNGTLGKAVLAMVGLSVCCGLLQAAPKDDNGWREGRFNTADNVRVTELASSDVTIVVDKLPEETDSMPPIVDIKNPADGSTVSRTVAITVDGWDNVNVASVRLFIDGQLKSSASAASLDYSWNTRKVASGSHTILAEAVDTSGNSATTSIQVNIGSGSVSDGGGGSKGKGRKK